MNRNKGDSKVLEKIATFRIFANFRHGIEATLVLYSVFPINNPLNPLPFTESPLKILILHNNPC